MKTKIPTGIKTLDQFLSGGIEKGKILLWPASSEELKLRRLEIENFKAYDKQLQQFLNENNRLHYTIS